MMGIFAIIFISYIVVGVLTTMIVPVWLFRRTESPQDFFVIAFVTVFLWWIVLIKIWLNFVDQRHNFAERLVVTPTWKGYWIVLRSGQCIPFGDAVSYAPSSSEINDANRTDEDQAVYQYDSAGHVYVRSNARHFGDLIDRHLPGKYDRKISDMIVMPDRSGYLMLDTSGTVFVFGAKVQHYGDLYLSGKTFSISHRWYKAPKGLRSARMFEEQVPRTESIAAGLQITAVDGA